MGVAVTAQDADAIAVLWQYNDTSVNIYMKTSEYIQSIKILVKTGIKDIILHANTFLQCNAMSWIDSLGNDKIKRFKMQETCRAVACISYSILSSRKEIKEPGEKMFF